MSDFFYVFDVIIEFFEVQVLQKFLQILVLVDFWVIWCGLCKILGLMLEKLVGEYNGVFELVKVDVDQEQQIVVVFQICLVFIVFLVKGGQIVDGFLGVVLEGQLCEFLVQYGVVLVVFVDVVVVEDELVLLDLQVQVDVLCVVIVVELDKEELKFDLVLVLLQIGVIVEVSVLIDVLLVNLFIDDCVVCVCVCLDFVSVLQDVLFVDVLDVCIVVDGDDLQVCYLCGVQQLLVGDDEVVLVQFLEMLWCDCIYDDGCLCKLLIDVFKVIQDDDLVGCYCCCMVLLLF